MRYEVIREIFNLCSNNQMRDVFVSEAQTDDPDGLVRGYCVGEDCSVEKTACPDGTLIYDLVIDGLRQRISLTPDD